MEISLSSRNFPAIFFCSTAILFPWNLQIRSKNFISETIALVYRAVQSLQRLCERITRITGRDPAASKVYELSKHFDPEDQDIKTNNTSSVSIEHLFLLDLLSPLVEQLTYEGLIDEIFSIKNSKKFFSYFLSYNLF